VGVLRATVAPSAVWAVVKADGYGHGAVTVARAALAAGADGLCVALVQEGAALRDAGIDAPILVLSEQPVEQAADLVRLGLTPTVYSGRFAEALARALPAGARLGVHVKVDTGMQRVGIAPADTLALVDDIAERTPAIRVDGIYTHLAVADEPAHPATEQQLAAFDDLLDALSASGRLPSVIHVANSAGALAHPPARRSLVRAGIAIYGISPGPDIDDLAAALRPAMSLRARVSHVKTVRAGSHVSYGWRHRFAADTTVATVPIGYADGVARRLGTLPDRPGADVLIGGRRCPIVGVVTMDQLVVDVGDADVAIGDEVVLIGEQGTHRIRAEDWAARLGTIGYEVVCAVSPRVPRIAIGGESM
jgi:alanine racemase